ncbi:hypothetical protein [Streptomyces sp. NPDC017673]|uniref:hypothetical protein n=1 Tax=unclassified Streptomyces TaxID=2593676 RepID=UPI00378FAAF7
MIIGLLLPLSSTQHLPSSYGASHLGMDLAPLLRDNRVPVHPQQPGDIGVQDVVLPLLGGQGQGPQ